MIISDERDEAARLESTTPKSGIMATQVRTPEQNFRLCCYLGGARFTATFGPLFNRVKIEEGS